MGGWLMGKIGLLNRNDRLTPAFTGGFRVRPGPYSHLSISATTATVLSDALTLTADYELIGERAAFNVTLQLELDEEQQLHPTLFLQRQPHAGGFRWQLSVGPPHATDRAMFGLFTSF